MDLTPDPKQVQVVFTGGRIECIGWIETRDVDPKGATEDGDICMEVGSFSIHVVSDGWAIYDERRERLEPGEYLVTSEGVFG